MNINKKEIIRLVTRAAKTYDASLCDKKLIVIYGATLSPEYIEINFEGRNFLHLTGLKYNSTKPKKAERFYSQAVNGKLKESDIDIKDHTTFEKLQVLCSAVNLKQNAKMIGDLNDSRRVYLQTDKLIGSVHSCIGFVKPNNLSSYIPNTVLNVDIRNKNIKTYQVFAILSTNKKGTAPVNVDYVAHDIKFRRLINTLMKTTDNYLISSVHEQQQLLYNSIIDNETLIKYNGNEEQLTLPNSIKHIGVGAFENNTTLKSIVIPDSVQSIGANAFYGCSNLKSAVIPQGCDCDITAFPRTCNVHRNNYSRLDKTLKHD